MAPGRRIIASWIWEVLNPEIEYLDFEAELLPRTLTFREHTREFERLKPLREGLMPDGRLVFDDMLGEEQEHDVVVSMHDSGLQNLHSKAVTLFEALVASEDFRKAFLSVVGALRARGVTQTPGSQDEERWLRKSAANVVNDVQGSLPQEFEDYAVWNEGHSELKQAAPAVSKNDLEQARAHFGSTVRDARKRLADLRKALSRSQDIPVVPSGSLD